jgi:hypothetical protein
MEPMAAWPTGAGFQSWTSRARWIELKAKNRTEWRQTGFLKITKITLTDQDFDFMALIELRRAWRIGMERGKNQGIKTLASLVSGQSVRLTIMSICL